MVSLTTWSQIVQRIRSQKFLVHLVGSSLGSSSCRWINMESLGSTTFDSCMSVILDYLAPAQKAQQKVEKHTNAICHMLHKISLAPLSHGILLTAQKKHRQVIPSLGFCGTCCQNSTHNQTLFSHSCHLSPVESKVQGL